MAMVARVALLVVSYCCCIASADVDYPVDVGWSVPSVGSPLRDLYTDRNLTMGIYTGICANLSTIDYQLWLVAFTSNSFTLCIIAVNKDRELKDLKTKVIWSANPSNPVRETGTLERSGSTGNLILKDSDGIVWSTNKTDNSSRVLTLRMTDMGNMMLLNGQDRVIWQSFDDLTDTLPSGRVLRSGNKITSSISTSNRTKGPYSLQVERNRLVLYSRFGEQQEAYWVWNAASSNMEIVAALCTNVLGSVFMVLSSEGEHVIDCDPEDNDRMMYLGGDSDVDTYPTFLSLQPDGNLEVVVWKNESTSWDTIYRLFENIPGLHQTCELPRKCGPFRTCSSSSGVCGVCPAGFVDVDPNQKELGCRQNVSTNSLESCTSTDAFQELNGYHYFAASFTKPTNKTSEECRRQCSDHCSCQASFYREENNNSYCYVSHNVGTIQEMNGDPTYRAFLRLHVAPEKKSKSHVPEIVGGTIGASAALIFMVLIMQRMKRKTVNVSEQQDETLLELSMSSLPRLFSPAELHNITNGYSHTLGAGGFGVVYKGVLDNGVQVAVKKLDTQISQQHCKQFYSEVEVLAKTKHWNLVQLLGVSTTKILVYEFMENSSLDTWLFNEEKKVVLTWEIRFNIALGTARGLSYLHEDCSEKIIHLDLKPQNILLDSEFNAKIGDFGLSKPINRQQSFAMTTMKGTPGYLAPDWLVEGVITEKIDVYSYGIVLLELVAGRRYTSFSSGPPVENTLELVDQSLHGVNEQQADRAVRVALLCMQTNPVRRPSMSTVVQVLLGLQPIPALQDCEIFFCRSAPPAFTNLMKVGTSSSGSSSSAVHSSVSNSLQAR